MSKRRIRILVADDSGFMQLLIKNILSADKNIEVIATAEDGFQAFQRTKEYKPDVVLMDLLMPNYDGLFGIEKIMETCPTPIVILSSVGNNNFNMVMIGLSLGAFDFLNKPDKAAGKLRTIDSEIISKVRVASTAKVSKLINHEVKRVNTSKHTFAKKLKYKIVVIGSSTGGPRAIEKVLTKFPRNLNVPVVIAQHMPENFINSFARRLKTLMPLNVLVAERRMEIESGNIYIARGDKNMILRRDKTSNKVIVDFVQDKFDEYNNPSVNSLMLSVAKVYDGEAIGVILTGMGRDGTKGMKEIFAKGGYTIAQDRKSSVVFGMPKEAIDSGCVKRVVPIEEMGEFIVNCLS